MTTPKRSTELTVVPGVDVRFDGAQILRDQTALKRSAERRASSTRDAVNATRVGAQNQASSASANTTISAQELHASTKTSHSERDQFLHYSEAANPFDPQAAELQTTWSSFAPVILCLNTYPNGITLSVHQNSALDIPPVEKKGEEPANCGQGVVGFAPQQFHLRFRDTRDYQLPTGKYFLHRENFLTALEGHLSQLRKSGLLSDTVLYFGTTTDPFLSLHKKFDVTMGVMELFERYVPGRTVFQTRSPMIISVLPALKALGDKAVVVMPVESISERAISRYTPGKPKIGERLVAAEGLRRQGVKVNLSVSPILPYGDPKRDAWDFAEVLERHADYITFGALASGQESDEKQLKSFPVAQKLESDEQYYFLRPHCFQYVYQAVKALSPEKLQLPVKRSAAVAAQLKLFAA